MEMKKLEEVFIQLFRLQSNKFTVKFVGEEIIRYSLKNILKMPNQGLNFYCIPQRIKYLLG